MDKNEALYTKIERAIETLANASDVLHRKNVIAGFDGFIDTVARPVKQYGCHGKGVVYYNTIAEFGNHIVERQKKSCSIELCKEKVKYGGNMPNFAHTISGFGVSTKCIGAFGKVDVDSVFYGLSQRCDLYSVAEPGECTALEFQDGKVMLYNNNGLNKMDWDTIVEKYGEAVLTQIIDQSDIFGLFNWGEVPHMEDIVDQIVSNIIPNCNLSSEKYIFLDFADFSNRSIDSVNNIVSLIGRIQKYFPVILSLNANEYTMLCDIFDIKFDEGEAKEESGRKLYEQLAVSVLIKHSCDCAQAWDNNGIYYAENYFVSNPYISTGGGDNFTAGFCLSILLKADLEAALILANATAGYYVKHGTSPALSELQAYLENWKKSIIGMNRLS